MTALRGEQTERPPALRAVRSAQVSPGVSRCNIVLSGSGLSMVHAQAGSSGSCWASSSSWSRAGSQSEAETVPIDHGPGPVRHVEPSLCLNLWHNARAAMLLVYFLSRRRFLVGSATSVLAGYPVVRAVSPALPSAGGFGELDATDPDGIDLYFDHGFRSG